MESSQWYFKIPSHPLVRAQLIEKIPNNWTWIDGVLVAPEDLIVRGEAIEKTGYRLGQNGDGTIIGWYNARKRSEEEPDLVALIAERKLPGFIHFNQAGSAGSLLKFEASKQIALAFLRIGYTGWLGFVKSRGDRARHSYSAVGDFRFSRWEGDLSGERGSQSPRVRLEWYEKHGGRFEDIKPLVKAYQNLGLREYSPVLAR